jgi:outer membrane protein assembly factor BamD (BamD/ComL family)
MTDTDLLTQFESLTLPFTEWTHRAHVKVAYLYLKQYPFEEALTHLRTAIQRYNAHNHVRESPTSGYNETTTHAFLHLIAATMRAYAESHPCDSADAFCDTHPQLMSRHALRFFYSPERRMHPDAKTTLVEPDLAPLPKLMAHSASPQ